jgi:beta-lactamase regulating signal transducer with metallopeptidase domain/thiol-disulfide isomerase/thioredoxin
MVPVFNGGSEVIAMLPDAWGLAAWLVDGALKSLVLLTIAGGAALVLQRRSAATVHRVWSVCFVGCLLVPAASIVAPQWSLRIVPAMPVSIVPATESNSPASDFLGADAPTQMGLHGVGTPGTSLPPMPAESRNEAAGDAPAMEGSAAMPAATAPATGFTASPGERGVPAISWIRAALMCWGVVATAIAGRMAVQYVALWRILRHCAPLRDSCWAEAVATASRRIGLARHVRLLQSESQLSPLAAGVLRPTIVLSAGASNWPELQRQSVLLHELAHVKRHDVLTQFVAGCVAAITWFNPLCWYGLAQMRKLRELACDDLVLAGGQAPTDYAVILLAVAKNYRHRTFVGAVGMARESNVERRILAILDSARNRMPLSRRAAAILAAAAGLITAGLGSMRLESRAVAAEEAANDPAKTDVAIDASTEESDEWTMAVMVTDEDGSPLPGARIHLSVWLVDRSQRPRFPNADFVTDDLGLARIPMPRDIEILRLWPAHQGYVPQFINFSEGTHEQGKLIPRTYQFRLARGTTLGGTIVDEQGNPIPGVKVDVSVEIDEPAWTTNPSPMISTWLTDSDFNQPTAETDAEGRWAIHDAPAKGEGADYQFRLKLVHGDYVRDSEWGELQRAQGVTTAMLRDGSAKIVLNRGKPVTGRIVDSTGKPVTKGLVIWSDNTYFAEGVNETQIQSDGRFETIPLPPKEHPITIAAPGFQPERRMVKVGPDLEPLEFALKPGKRLALRLVDKAGKPISGVYVGMDTWRGVESLYNEDHPNVPDSGIPRHPDATGLYVWDWAPEDAVSLRISAVGYAATKVSLVARDEEHVVTLAPQLKFSGTVSNSKTGEPLPAFRITPVVVFRPQFYSVSFDDSVQGKAGRYEIPIDTYDPDYRYLIRVEAGGFRSAMSEISYGESDGAVVQDFQLEPAPARRGRVIGSDGKPVQGAEIVVGTPSVVPMEEYGRFSFNETGLGVTTDAEGWFELAATWEPSRIRAIHDLGYAEVLRGPDDEIGELRLQAWASLKGRLVQDGRPMGQQRIIVTPLPNRGLLEARFQESYQILTDPDGRFEFERLAPMELSCRTSLGPWEESELTSSESVALKLSPGEQREVTLGGNGIGITGKVVSTGRGDVPLDRNWSLNYLVSRERGIELPESLALGFDPKGPIQTEWLGDPEFSNWLATRDVHFVKLTPEGDLHVHGVRPGKYDLVLKLYEQPAGCLVQTVGEKVVPVEVTEADVAAGSMGLGEIEVPCRVGPRVGENMQAYKFVDAEGRERTVHDMRGRYVLMHVWASWCEPCLTVMPDLAAMREEQAAAPVTFVGLNVDAEKDAGRALAVRRGWTWAQNYLGENSEMSKQLALSTTPSYFLIGPDGLLIASSAEWREVRSALTKALEEAR